MATSKRVEKVTESRVVTDVLEKDLPDILHPEEGDTYYSSNQNLLIVIYQIKNGKIYVCAGGKNKIFTKKHFAAFLHSIFAVSSHRCQLEAYDIQ